MRRSYAGGARASTLTGTVAPADALIPVGTLLGWPDPSDGPFSAVINRGNASEEKILCSDNTGGFLTVLIRGYDGTAAADHVAGETVQHIATSIDDDEANDHVNASIDVHGLVGGDRVVGETKTATLQGKSMSGLDNTFTDLPRLASPEIDGDLTDLATADETLQDNIDTEATARANAVTAEAEARAAADVVLQTNIDDEATARIATDATLTPIDTFNDGQADQDAALDAAVAAQDTVNDAFDVLHARQAWAMAAGTTNHVYGGSSRGPVSTSPTFPAGRFTHAPIVLVTFQTGNAGFGLLSYAVSNVTTSGFDLTSVEPASFSIAGGSPDSPVVAAATHTFGWLAIQMTSGAASG